MILVFKVMAPIIVLYS